MLYRSGLRINEALALCPKDIDLDAGAVRVLHGKGNKKAGILKRVHAHGFRHTHAAELSRESDQSRSTSQPTVAGAGIVVATLVAGTV